MKGFVDFLIKNNALKFGKFKTKSNRDSPYFINTGILCDSKTSIKLANYYCKKINENITDFDVLFGPAYKGIPLANSICIQMYNKYKKNCKYSSIRKEKKEHGDKGIFLGKKLEKNDKVIIIDDVITTGKTKKQAIDEIKKIGCKILGVIIAVDRMEKEKIDDKITCVEKFQKQTKIKVYSIINIKEILKKIKNKKQYEDCQKYCQKYCLL